MSRHAFPKILHNSLWHTTHRDRYRAIRDRGSIVPDPSLPDSERWKTSRGPHYYPYVRTIGGVSLFDFFEFDVESYTENYPRSAWREFVPYRKEWGESIWIEIDRASVAEHLIGGADLVARWKQEGAQRHTIMPNIEAAHLGPIPVGAFLRVIEADVQGIRLAASLEAT